MPRLVLRGIGIALACGAILQPDAAPGDEPGSRPLPTASLPARHPTSRQEAIRRGGSGGGSSSGGFWLSTAGIAVALAAFGAISLGARRLNPAADSGSLKVIGRASLSSRQAVYLLRAGDRVLILGAGGQGPPSLLGEMSGSDVAKRPERPGGSS